MFLDVLLKLLVIFGTIAICGALCGLTCYIVAILREKRDA